MTATAQYFAVTGVKVDESSLKDVDRFLKKIEDKFKKGLNTGKVGGASKGIRVNAYIDQARFNKHFSSVINKAVNGTPIAIKNIGIDPTSFKSKVQALLKNTSIRADIVGVITKGSISQMKAQLAAAFANISVGVRLGNVRTPKTPGGGNNAPGGGGRNPGKGTVPGFWERMMGRPGKDDLSSPIRRYYDNMLSDSFGKIDTPTGRIAGTALGGLGRLGSKSVVGRGVSSLGGMIGGPKFGAAGLVLSGVGSIVTSSLGGIFKAAGAVITAPFRALGAASDFVVGSFYRLAMAAIPLVGAFSVINKNVQEVTAREISLTSTAKRFGTDSTTEKAWLKTMADTEGVRYSELVKPYTGFLSGYAPVAGVDASRNMFEAFTQYGRTHGATNLSFGNAYYAMQQMASMGTVMSQELNQQLAEAQGFSGVKTLMAEAYQMSLGRTGDQIKPVTESLKELKDAMQKGNVTTSKVFPYFEQLLRRESARGLDIARVSSQAEQGRFQTQIDMGWQNFTMAGGERGLSFFWRMMQRMGDWWESNGASLGVQFEKFTLWVNVARIAISELFDFITTGENNDLVKIINDWGINIQGIRDEVVKIFSNLGNTFQGSGTSLADTLLVKIQNFSDSLIKILQSVNVMLEGLSQMFSAFDEWRNQSWLERLTSGSGFKILGGFGKVVQGGYGVATEGTGAALDILSKTSSNRPNTEASRMFGTQLAPINTDGPTRFGTPALSQLPLTSPADSIPMFTQPQRQTIDLNINVKGDPEQVKMFAANEIADQLKTKVPEIATNTFSVMVNKSATGSVKY